jgi:hypothetical protein
LQEREQCLFGKLGLLCCPTSGWQPPCQRWLALFLCRLCLGRCEMAALQQPWHQLGNAMGNIAAAQQMYAGAALEAQEACVALGNQPQPVLADVHAALLGIAQQLGNFQQLTEQRFAGLEARFAGLEARFTGLEARFTGLEEQVHGLEEQVHGLEGMTQDNTNSINRSLNRQAGDDAHILWLYNAQREQPNQPALTRASAQTEDMQTINNLLQIYGLVLQGNVTQRRNRLLHHLGSL